MSFVQIIEFTSSRADEIRALAEGLQDSADERPRPRVMACADRDQPNHFFTIVEFGSYEEAMANSQRPETSAFAAKMAELCDGPPTFRNLDVIDTM